MLSTEQRQERLAAALDDYDRSALKGPEFQRQLRLALREGLLGAILQEIESEFQLHEFIELRQKVRALEAKFFDF